MSRCEYGAVLEQLAVVVPVALRRLDLGRALQVEHPLDRAGVGLEAPGRADRQDEVVARAVADRPEDRVAGALALVDEQHLVGLAVAIERRRPASGSAGRTTPMTMSVLKKSGMRPVTASPRGSIAGGVDQAMVVVAVVGLLEADLAHRLDPVGPRRRDEVVQERRLRPVKPSTPNSSSAYSEPSGARCWVWRLWRDAAARCVEHGRLASPKSEEASLDVR